MTFLTLAALVILMLGAAGVIYAMLLWRRVVDEGKIAARPPKKSDP
jgi:hypothetical protein